MRKVLFGCALALLVAIGACKKEDVTITASFDFSLVEGTEYKFSATTESYDSAVWNIEDKVYRGGTINHAFSAMGTYEVTLTVYTTNHDESVVEDKTSQSITLADQFETIKIQTKFGDIRMFLYQTTPKHRENFLKLTKDGYFDGTTFHRIINDFVIQGGDVNSKDEDPSNDGQGGPGYTIDAEIKSTLKHVYGAVGAARRGNDVNPEMASNGSQFYIVENAGGTPNLDGQYTVFGIVFDGMDVVSEIATQAKDSRDRPTTDIEMQVDAVWYTPEELKTQFSFDIPAE